MGWLCPSFGIIISCVIKELFENPHINITEDDKKRIIDILKARPIFRVPEEYYPLKFSLLPLTIIAFKGPKP